MRRQRTVLKGTEGRRKNGLEPRGNGNRRGREGRMGRAAPRGNGWNRESERERWESGEDGMEAEWKRKKKEVGESAKWDDGKKSAYVRKEWESGKMGVRDGQNGTTE
jgi:hypothetical protein